MPIFVAAHCGFTLCCSLVMSPAREVLTDGTERELDFAFMRSSRIRFIHFPESIDPDVAIQQKVRSPSLPNQFQRCLPFGDMDGFTDFA